jgi:hypothetical protein
MYVTSFLNTPLGVILVLLFFNERERKGEGDE